MPWTAVTCLAIALSIATAEPSTPVPTYGRSASSSMPCTVPSSPSGPCSSGTTTVRPAPDGVTASVGSMTSPSASRRPGSASGPAAERAPGLGRRGPSDRRGAMPMGVMRYFAGSAARSTWAAVVQLTSCSADWPPKMTMRLMRSSVVVSSGLDASAAMRPDGTVCSDAFQSRLTSPRPPAAGWSGPTSRSTASRSTRARVQPGQLFVPLVAERDGHEFIAGALERGAAAYLTSQPRSGRHGDRGARHAARPDGAGGGAATRRSTARSSASPARWARPPPRISAWAALGASRRTWANERSFNNEQGLPTTLLNTPDGTEVLVLEMGMRGFGEIAELCAIARPTIGVVTRVAEAHSDRVGGIEGVARAKAELIEALPADGIAILNADDPRVRAMARPAPRRVLLFGEADDADVRVSDVRARRTRPCQSFHLDTPWGACDVRLAISGRHMAQQRGGCAGVRRRGRRRPRRRRRGAQPTSA